MTEALRNKTDKGSGDRTDEADAVEAVMEDEHRPDASQHPPNDFDIWEKATGGRRKHVSFHCVEQYPFCECSFVNDFAISFTAEKR
ncbi:hypothetical protein Tco_0404419 [Tanacetum coccineum]